MYFSSSKGTVRVVTGIRIQYSDNCDSEDASCYTMSRFRIWSWVDVSAGSAASLTVQSLSLRIAAKAISLGCACNVCTKHTNKDKFLPEVVKQNFGGQLVKGWPALLVQKCCQRAPTVCHQAASGVVDSYLVQQGPAPGQAGATFTKL